MVSKQERIEDWGQQSGKAFVAAAVEKAKAARVNPCKAKALFGGRPCGAPTISNETTCRACQQNNVLEDRDGRRFVIFLALASGEAPKSVAEKLGVSLKTVEYHWAQVKRIFGFQSCE